MSLPTLEELKRKIDALIDEYGDDLVVLDMDGFHFYKATVNTATTATEISEWGFPRGTQYIQFHSAR